MHSAAINEGKLRLGPQGESQSLFAQEGRLEVRLTRDPRDIHAAQTLRYRVFYEEMGAAATEAMASERRDFDDFDLLCDHLLVIDHDRPAGERVVGSYRLLRQEIAERSGGFYSASEYDIEPLLAMVQPGDLLELGRSCVHQDYRTNAIIQLLWRGLAGYFSGYEIKYIFGCASLPGTDVSALQMPLAYLHHEHLAPSKLRIRALPERYVNMNLMARGELDHRAALRQLPPLIKAYLRLGSFVGEGAVVDHQFRTTDVFIVCDIHGVADKYHRHFERNELATI